MAAEQLLLGVPPCRPEADTCPLVRQLCRQPGPAAGHAVVVCNDRPIVSSLMNMSVVETARRIARQDLSSRAVVAACLARIAEVNPRLNAVVALRADAALAEADEADRQVARGELRGPMHGVPFTVKDWIDAADLPCAGGRVAYRSRMPARDAVVVARLRAAGGILLGKTSVGPDNEM
jgi:amidase